MRFDVITLFPELFAPHLSQGITRRAFESGAGRGAPVAAARFCRRAYRRVDDRPFGGGPGMVMLAEPLLALPAGHRADRNEAEPRPRWCCSRPPAAPGPGPGRAIQPAGAGAVLLCGRYEGIDQRFIDACVTCNQPGRLRAVGRRIAGAGLARRRGAPAARRAQRRPQPPAGQLQSDGLLDCPHYSRPEVWSCRRRPVAVPPVLLSGHHAAHRAPGGASRRLR
jgi:tRNA (guanine37-N1)-methyltransferase